MEQLGGLDAAFVYAETAGAAHVTFFGIYDPSTAPGGVVTFDDVVAHIGSRLGADRVFRSVLARVPFDLDHPYWVRDRNFELSQHLHRLTLPRPGDWRQLCDQVSQLHARRLDLRRPPWEGYVIEGLGRIKAVPKGAFAVCVKVHHSAVDGVTGLSIVNGLHDLTPETAPPPDDDWTPESLPSSLNLLARTAVTFARRPAQLASAATRSLPLLSRLPGSITRRLPVGHRIEHEPSIDVPHSRFNGHTDSSRNFDARSYDLAAVKAARTLVPGATVNDIAIAGIGGAMRRYLLGRDELPEKSLVTAIAISLHTDSERRHGVNQISVVRVPLGTNIADPLARLKAVHESTAHSKAASAAVGEQVLEYAEFVPGALVVTALRFGMAANLGRLAEQSRISNTLVSTMRGPDFPVYLRGARMIAGYALSPFTQGCGLIHNVISYCGRVVVSINGCPVVLPDIGHYGDCMDASFAELTSAAKTAPRRRARIKP
ncbi:MAG TPA: wax ester/triacylglycerol synthase family O-acyltransferase [Mycobacterium sp.]|nr:wax ester/triacylglycerol synthase family O-acyltransferase [Mycobacterium sp.]